MTAGRTSRMGLALGLGTLVALVAGTPSALAADHGVTIEGQVFSPGRVTVEVGDTVTWTNLDGFSHTATADDGTFDTDGIPKSSTDTIRFTAAGEYPYHCSIHPDMRGRVIVVAAGGEPTAPPTDTVAAAGGAEGADDAESGGLATLLALAILAAAWAWRLRSMAPATRRG